MAEVYSSFYAGPVATWRAQVRTENPRKNEGVLRSGLPFSRDPLPDCIEGEAYHNWRDFPAGIGARHGVNICTDCGLGSVYDSA